MAPRRIISHRDQRQPSWFIEASPPPSLEQDRMPRLQPSEPQAPAPKPPRRAPQPRQTDMFPGLKPPRSGQPEEREVPEDKEAPKVPPILGPHGPEDLGPDDAGIGNQSQWQLTNNAEAMSPDQMVHSLLTKYDASDDKVRDWGSQWYGTAQEYINNLAKATRRDPKQVAAVMAAFSPRTAWDTNMQQATHFLLNYDPHNPEAMDATMPGLGENLERAKRIFHATDENGYLAALQGGNDAPKITNFYNNMNGDSNAVTIDTWMARAIMGAGHDLADSASSQRALGWTGGYDKMADAVREAARQRGISPAAMQAIVWSHVNNTANYGELTPKEYQKKTRQKERQWSKTPSAKPLPDYVHGPGWNSVNPETGQTYLPQPDVEKMRGYNPKRGGIVPALERLAYWVSDD